MADIGVYSTRWEEAEGGANCPADGRPPRGSGEPNGPPQAPERTVRRPSAARATGELGGIGWTVLDIAGIGGHPSATNAAASGERCRRTAAPKLAAKRLCTAAKYSGFAAPAHGAQGFCPAGARSPRPATGRAPRFAHGVHQSGRWSTFVLRTPVFALGAARRDRTGVPSCCALRCSPSGRPVGLTPTG